jgi:hypothetical protein
LRIVAHALACLIGLATTTLLRAAVAEGVAVEQANDTQRAEARTLFLRARQAFDQRRFVDALDDFRASYDVVASPNARLMIAHSLRELGRNAEAYEELSASLAQAEKAAASDPKYAGSADSARQEMDQIRGRVGMVTVTVTSDDPAASLTIGGRRVERARWGTPVPVDPGTITVSLSSAQGSTVEELKVDAGGEASLSIGARKDDDPKPLPPPPPPPVTGDPQPIWSGDTQRIVSYAVGGVGAASLVVMGVFGGLALKKHDELLDACGEAPCPERQDDIDAGRTFKLVSNVTLVAGVALLAAGVTLYFTAADDAPPETKPTTALVMGPASLTLTGSF